MVNDEEMTGRSISPHSDPFLSLDRIVSYDAKTSVGVMTFVCGRDFFRGHFPDYPVVPGVVLLEAMCQSAAVGIPIGQREGR